MRELCEGSIFTDLPRPDDYKAYIEFDVCNSLPNIIGPAAKTGNYLGYHPGVLHRSHATLLHQQTNLHHLLKYYDPKITHDRIVGCVVATHFPDEPADGWTIPDSLDDVIPIHAAAVMFKMAQGALEALQEMQADDKWSVSIEVVSKTLADLGLYVPSTGALYPIAEAPDDILDTAKMGEDGLLRVGKHKSGEQIVLAYGATHGRVCFQGLGYTPNPAEVIARITGVQLQSLDLAEAVGQLGGKALQVIKHGTAYARRGDFHGIPASESNPVAIVEFCGRRALMTRSHVMEMLSAKIISKKH